MSAHVQSLDVFFCMLIDEQRDTRINLAKLEGSTKPGGADGSDTPLPQHVVKAGSTRLAIQLDRINAALERYAAGQYGICCRCEMEIPHGRLMADPATPFCLDCTEELAEAKQHEQHRMGRVR